MADVTKDMKEEQASVQMKAMAVEQVVSTRSLGSLASVQDMFKGAKQKLTFYAIMAIVVGSMAGLLFGFDQNLLNLVLDEDDFRRQMEMPLAPEVCGPNGVTGASDPIWVANRKGLIQALYPIGCAAASPFAGALNDRFGRFKTLWLGMIIFFIGAGIQTGATGYPMLLAGRLIAGGSVGIMSSVVPVYVSELAPHHLRGGLGSLFQVGITFGAFFSSVWCMIAKAAVPDGADYLWRIEAGFQLVIGLCMAFGMCFIPESPRWLFKSGQAHKAKAVLAKLRGSASEEVTNMEMKEIEDEVEAEKHMNGRITELFSKKVRLATLVALTIPMLQQFTGVNVLMGFSASIFNEMCIDGNTVTLVQNAVNHLATWTAVLYWSDNVGRKKMLVATSGFIFILWVIGCTVMWTVDYTQSRPAAYGIAFLNCVYAATFAVAWGPNGWVIPNEVLPLRLRGKGSGVATFNNFFFTFVVMYTAPIAQATIGFAGNMMIYACLMALAVPALWFFLPETKGVPLEEMEAKFDLPLKEYVRNNASDLRRRVHPEGGEEDTSRV